MSNPEEEQDKAWLFSYDRKFMLTNPSMQHFTEARAQIEQIPNVYTPENSERLYQIIRNIHSSKK